MSMSVINHIPINSKLVSQKSLSLLHKFAGLRIESTDFTVTPTTDNALTVSHKGDTVTFKVGDLNTEEFLTVFGVPDTDIIDGASSEKIRVIIRESDVVDLGIMASVSEFSVKLITIDPIDV